MHTWKEHNSAAITDRQEQRGFRRVKPYREKDETRTSRERAPMNELVIGDYLTPALLYTLFRV